MKLLMLGGTEFVGRAVVEAALARGWEVTVFHRGRHAAPAGVTSLIGDRTTGPDGLAALATGSWDAVVDTWSAAPSAVRDVARLLADRVGAGTGPNGAAVGRTDARGGRHAVFAAFGPAFWLGLPLGEDERIDLLRRLVPADPPPADPPPCENRDGSRSEGRDEGRDENRDKSRDESREEGPGEGPCGARALAVVEGMLAADPRGVQPLLCRWFGDDRALPAA
ncbi:hypothetical protein ACWCQ0_47190, partial [Streptomyces massasporeus]